MIDSCEYIVKRKTEGKYLWQKVTLAFSCLFFFAILLILILTLTPLYVMIPLILLALALTALLAFITWRILSVEYEITVGGGDLIITTIYGRSLRKQTLNLSVAAISEIGEYDEDAYAEISKISLQKNYLCISSLSSPDMYYAIFDEDKERCILYFDATDEAIKLLKRYNLGAFRASEKRMNK